MSKRAVCIFYYIKYDRRLFCWLHLEKIVLLFYDSTDLVLQSIYTVLAIKAASGKLVTHTHTHTHTLKGQSSNMGTGQGFK